MGVLPIPISGSILTAVFGQQEALIFGEALIFTDTSHGTLLNEDSASMQRTLQLDGQTVKWKRIKSPNKNLANTRSSV